MNISVLASVLVVDSGSISLGKRLLIPVLGRVEATGKQSLSPGQIVNFLIIEKILDNLIFICYNDYSKKKKGTHKNEKGNLL